MTLVTLQNQFEIQGQYTYIIKAIGLYASKKLRCFIFTLITETFCLFFLLEIILYLEDVKGFRGKGVHHIFCATENL
jgi:hypothetical protein